MGDDSSEQFSLRWNNFFSNLTSGFHSLWQEEDFVDVTLAAEGKFVQAHKIVLSVCSPYFMQLFKVNPCKHPIVILKDVGYKDLSGLLQFMYRGEVNVYQEELANFLKTAELLQVKGLTSNESQAAGKDTEGKPPPSPQEEKKKQIPWSSSAVTISGKRKRPELDQVNSDSPNRSCEMSTTAIPPVPNLPKLEPIDFVESECSENSQVNDALASFFEAESSRPVTNKPATFRVTSRGRLQLVQNNYVYHCNRQKDNKIFWKCAEYNRTGCRGRCISIGWAVTVTHALHNHHPSWSESTDESKVISDLSEMRHMFASPRPVTDKNFPRNLPKQINDTSPINVEGF